jgi:hypothetical protein
MIIDRLPFDAAHAVSRAHHSIARAHAIAAVRAAVHAADMLSKTAVSFLLASLLVPAALLAGCGQSAADKAKNQVCDARDDIGKQVKTLQGLTVSTATTSQIKDSLTAIRDDLSKIANAQGDLNGERKKNVQAANSAFATTVRQTVTSLGTSLSLANAKTQISDALQKLATSYKDTFANIDCG